VFAYERPTVELQLARAVSGELLEPIVTTDDHPVWVEEAKDWVPVGRLVEGWTLASFEGPLLVVEISATSQTELVFNFEVEQLHSYQIAQSGVLVHNASAPCPKVHGNSKASPKPQHRYEIVDAAAEGDVVKTGISGQRMNANGTSPRANRQVNRLNAAEAGRYEARVVERDIPGRSKALANEQAATDALHAEGNSLRMQQRPTPQSQ